jgi:anti-anti-sigma regulatory factor
MGTESESLKVLNLEGNMGVERAAELKKELRTYLDSTKKLIIDLSRLKTADLSFLQLLYAVKLQAVNEGKELTFTGEISDKLGEVLISSGFCTEVPEDGKDLEFALVNFPRTAKD